MGPSPSEGAEMERRNSQESTNYRRPAEQQQQPSHHVQPSNPGRAQGSAKGWQLCSSPLQPCRLLEPCTPSLGGFVCPPEAQRPAAALADIPNPSFPVYQQQQQQQQLSSQSYGYKEPAAPASTQRNAPSGGGVSTPQGSTAPSPPPLSIP